jgi:hypothetical protein
MHQLTSTCTAPAVVRLQQEAERVVIHEHRAPQVAADAREILHVVPVRRGDARIAVQPRCSGTS